MPNKKPAGFLLGLLFGPEDGGDMLTDYTALYAKKYNFKTTSVRTLDPTYIIYTCMLGYGPKILLLQQLLFCLV
jgi:hypothetical protein